MEYRVFSGNGNDAVVVAATCGPQEAIAIARREAGLVGELKAVPVSHADWRCFHYRVAGGIEPFAAMEAAENHQFSMQALSCVAPDSHGAFMDAPELLGNGVWR